MILALLGAPFAPSLKYLVDADGVEGSDLASFAQERPGRAAQIIELLYRVQRGARLHEIAALSNRMPDPRGSCVKFWS
jgi:hypothetical protein